MIRIFNCSSLSSDLLGRAETGERVPHTTPHQEDLLWKPPGQSQRAAKARRGPGQKRRHYFLGPYNSYSSKKDEVSVKVLHQPLFPGCSRTWQAYVQQNIIPSLKLSGLIAIFGEFWKFSFIIPEP